MNQLTQTRPHWFALFFAMAGATSLLGATYDPLSIDSRSAPSHIELMAHDSARSRDIPVRVYLPSSSGSAPVVLFSHGLGGSRAGSSFLGEHWASRGYVAVFLQHSGSDDSVWKNEPGSDRMAALKKAASLDNFLLRVHDVRALLDQLETWNAAKGHPLAGRLDLAHIGMSGHSFGAVTTEAVSGETLPASGQRFTDPRIKAAVIFSPSSPELGDPAKAFGAVKIPWLLMTGTKDVAPIGHADMKSRLAVYPALRGAAKYELVLNNAEHSVFTDRPLPGDKEPRNPNHHRAILAISTAFWDAYLRNNSDARAWLDSTGPRSILEPNDRWQCVSANGR
jgi:predicted dienelactone hydrolase